MTPEISRKNGLYASLGWRCMVQTGERSFPNRSRACANALKKPGDPFPAGRCGLSAPSVTTHRWLRLGYDTYPQKGELLGTILAMGGVVGIALVVWILVSVALEEDEFWDNLR